MGGAALRVVQGDIANRDLLPGGGVCGAIHRTAGPELAAACRPLAPCSTGEARITPGFRLPARWVVHAVGPVWSGGDAGEDTLLAACYRESIRLAAENDAISIAFPAISTGIYGFPPDRAAPLAVAAAREAVAVHPTVGEVIFCCFDTASAERHRRAQT